MEYKIIQKDYYSRANLVSTRYQIQRKRKFLWIFPYWVYLKETVKGWTSSTDWISTISFETSNEAEDFIQKLNEGTPLEGETKKEIKRIVSNENLSRRS
jgi:hypothetical protein